MTDIPQSVYDNRSASTKDLCKLVGFAFKYDDLYHEMNKLTKNVDSLLAISRHPALYSSIHSSTNKEYIQLSDAITEAAKSPESFLVSFPTINMYAVFTPGNYLKFTQEYSKSPQNEVPDLYQIVLSGFPQKLVFVSDTAEYHERICRIASELFGVNSKVDGNRITMDILVDNTKDLKTMHDRLITEVRSRGSTKMKDSIHFPHQETVGAHEFVTYDLMKTLAARLDNVSSLLALLATKPDHSTIYNFIGDGIVANIGGTINGNISITTPQAKASQFVKENPPKVETKRDYYDRFVAQTGAGDVSMNDFGSLLKSLGYKKKRVGDSKYGWVKR